MLKNVQQITRLFSITCILLLSTFFVANAQGLDMPRESPPVELKQTIGLTKITVNYSSPRVIRHGDDRTGKIWGGPAWYGFMKVGTAEIPWRAGANENTIVIFSEDVKIEGKELKAGKYGLYMALSEDGNTTVIFSNNSERWGSFGYDPHEDALRVDVTSEACEFVNPLTYSFIDVGEDYGIMALSWEKKRIPFKIEVDNSTEAILANFRGQLHHGKSSEWQSLNDAASYCAQNNTNHEEALKWVDQSIHMDKNFRNVSTKAQLLYQAGKNEEAMNTSDELAQMADINQLNNLGYQMLGIGMKDKAVEYFKLNAERNPSDANCQDSLGEAYMAKGENKKAIKCFKKSLSMNPADNVKQNSIANLKKLGVEHKGK